jgi:hypothetical protein
MGVHFVESKADPEKSSAKVHRHAPPVGLKIFTPQVDVVDDALGAADDGATAVIAATTRHTVHTNVCRKILRMFASHF